MVNKTYTVEEVSLHFGITPRTLHYYEEIGLLQEVSRTEGGHRYYDQRTVDQLSHIIRIKNVMGISLQDISRILDAERNLEQIKELFQQQESDAERIKLLDQGAEVLQELVNTIEDKITNLQTLRDSFMKRLDIVNEKRKI